MVEKTKKALAILQTRGCFAASTPAPPLAATSTVPAQNGGGTGTTVAGNNPSSTNGSQVESSTGDREGSLKRLSGEIVAQTIRAIEDKVAEVKRKDGWYFLFLSSSACNLFVEYVSMEHAKYPAVLTRLFRRGREEGRGGRGTACRESGGSRVQSERTPTSSSNAGCSVVSKKPRRRPSPRIVPSSTW